MADVIAIDVLADVIATYVCYTCDRWKVTLVGVMTTCIEWMVDVIAIVADGMATGVECFDYGRCCCLCGRLISHMGSITQFTLKNNIKQDEKPTSTWFTLF